MFITAPVRWKTVEKEEALIEKLKQVQGVKESSTTLSAGLFWYKADENSAYLTEEYKTEKKEKMK